MKRLIAILACAVMPAVFLFAADDSSGAGGGGFAGNYPEFALGVHYAHLELSGDSEPLDNQDGIRFEGRWSAPLFDPLPQLRLGLALALAYGSDNTENGAIIVNHGQLIVLAGSREQRFTTVEPELQLSWRQRIAGQFFIEPGVAGGWLFGYYHLDLDETEADDDIAEWSNTWSTREFLRVGCQVQGGLAGLEGGYLRGGELDFADSISGDISEFYIGIWGALQF